MHYKENPIKMVIHQVKTFNIFAAIRDLFNPVYGGFLLFLYFVESLRKYARSEVCRRHDDCEERTTFLHSRLLQQARVKKEKNV